MSASDSAPQAGLAGAIADEIVRRFAPTNVLDYGCLSTDLVVALQHHGVESWAIVPADGDLASAPAELRDHLRVEPADRSLPADLPPTFDLVMCVGVVELLDEPEAARVIASLCSVTERILFAAAGGTEQGVSTDWAATFEAHGFRRAVPADAEFIAPGATVFARQDLDVADASLPPSSDIDALRRQVTALRDEVTTLNADRDRLRARIEQLHSLAADAVKERETSLAEQHRHELEVAVQQAVKAQRDEYESSHTWQVGRKIVGGAAQAKSTLRKLSKRGQ